jgi:hypothetical protein
MAIRIPRGYDVNRPYYNEYCEGVRPVAGSTAKEAWTGLAHTRIDQLHHDPIVIEPGTLIGMVTGGNVVAAGKIVPAILGTGTVTWATGGAPVVNATFNLDPGGLIQIGETNDWGLPVSSGDHAVGRVKPLGVCYQPIYSFMLQSLYTNYVRNTAVGVLTDYVIQVPAINSDEWAIEAGDAVILGTGRRHGIGLTGTHLSGYHLAGRYARAQSYPTLSDLNDRMVGRCLRKVKLGTGGSSTSQGDRLADKLSDFTIDTNANVEFDHLAKVQTVPGLNLTGSGTKGIPGYYLGARADASKVYWGLTMLIRL